MFSGAFTRILVFPPFLSVTCFPALFLGYLFPRPFRRLHVFPRFFSDTCFPALSVGYMLPALFLSYLFFCPFRRLHVFSRFFSDTCFPALSAGYIFPRLFSRIVFFSRFQSVAFSYTNTFHPVSVFTCFLEAALFALSFQNMANYLLLNYLQLPINKVNKTVWRPHLECEPLLSTIPEEAIYFHHSF